MTTRADVAAMIDHTLLKPEATHAQVAELATEAKRLGTFSICVSPSMLPVAVPEGVAVATVVGFPSGAVHPSIMARFSNINRTGISRTEVAVGTSSEISIFLAIAFAMPRSGDSLAPGKEPMRLSGEAAIFFASCAARISSG